MFSTEILQEKTRRQMLLLFRTRCLTVTGDEGRVPGDGTFTWLHSGRPEASRGT